ncbi:PAAR domain-containing protein [Sphingomonas segetis]|jgi:uncharacterized Zn-binding protein involved in type VI secretion|uniref:PAAR domain-containing protein n=1 Tax=Sphingomonas segetis TaxID=1104779 RepID=UPI0012D2CA89|nr:PAAR domain-containing protein [Sphingomonas segetis]
MGKPAARVTDMHVCPMVTGLVPHVGGPIIPPCQLNVLTCMMPQARISDMAICVGPIDMIIQGSPTVLVGKLPAARMGDMTAHGGVIVTGCFTVLIGEVGAGGGGGGGGGAGAGGPGAGFDIAAQAKAFIGALTEGKYFPRPAEQAKTFKAAAKSGAPFCERCANIAAAAAEAARKLAPGIGKAAGDAVRKQ